MHADSTTIHTVCQPVTHHSHSMPCEGQSHKAAVCQIFVPCCWRESVRVVDALVRPPTCTAPTPSFSHSQAADTAAIRAAITEEARSRGIEHTLKEERPPVARRGMRLPAELLGASLGASNEQLLQLLQQAFDGRLPGLQLNVSSTGQDAQADAAEQEEEPEVSHSANMRATLGYVGRS